MKILVTAGPTREAIDPVRFLSNRSSGKMGYAIAESALRHGHEVHLISGPVALSAADGIEVTQVTSAADMLESVLKEFGSCNALIMCAAVADWRPAAVAGQKLKKTDSMSSLALERTADILKAVAEVKQSQIVVGFAAETQNTEAEAERKLLEKNLNMIVANDVSRTDAGFGSDNNAVTLITATDKTVLPLMSKADVADRIISRVEAM